MNALNICAVCCDMSVRYRESHNLETARKKATTAERCLDLTHTGTPRAEFLPEDMVPDLLTCSKSAR